MARASKGDAAAFLRDVVLSFDGTDCLLWPYALSTAGYGKINIDRRVLIVSRIACEAASGPCPSPDHEAAHSCGNRACVNPNHIRWATRTENMADELLHGTRQRGDRKVNAKLSWLAVEDIRHRLRRGEGVNALGRAYGVTGAAISQVLHGKRWVSP